MRVLIVTHHFLPGTGGPQVRLSALAATRAADGDRPAAELSSAARLHAPLG